MNIKENLSVFKYVYIALGRNTKNGREQRLRLIILNINTII